MTLPTQLVLRAMLIDPSREVYGLELCTFAGLASGTIHPILARLENIGWVESRWEDLDPVEAGRPRRRYYRLTREGALRAQVALDRVSASRSRVARFRTGLSGGSA
jgi:PadR family transcriptional regulator, regulatory protein PadR